MKRRKWETRRGQDVTVNKELCKLTSKWSEVEFLLWRLNVSKFAIVSNLSVQTLSQLIFIVVVNCAEVQRYQTAETLASFPKETESRARYKKESTQWEKCHHSIQKKSIIIQNLKKLVRSYLCVFHKCLQCNIAEDVKKQIYTIFLTWKCFQFINSMV